MCPPPFLHLLPVESPGGVETLYEVGGESEEHGVAGGAAHHAQHRQPHVSQGLWGEPVEEVEGCVRVEVEEVGNMSGGGGGTCEVSTNPPAIADAQHVGHGFKEGPGVLLPPSNILEITHLT